ncbi:MAG: PEGA domain-containing protein [Deltaproteobacteria bacterium]|nr:PEGA domain-containing protein [Deltaproteobacteria bacterium]
MRFVLALMCLLSLSLPLRAQEEGGDSEPSERPGSDSPEAVTRARAREGFGARRRAQAFLIPLDEKARMPTSRVALAIERALSGARQYDVVDLAKALAADAQPDQVAKAQQGRQKEAEGHEAFGARKFPEAALRYKEAINFFARGLADSDAREQAELWLRQGCAQMLAGDSKSAKDAFMQAALLDPLNKVSPRSIDPVAEGPMLGARADLEAAGTGTLEVDPRPAGAKVIVDGQFKGTTPAKLELPIGRHLVRIERTGFFPQAELVEVRGGRESEFSITLQATPGAATLNQTIAGAVEEASRGTTGPMTSKLAEKFSLDRVLIGSVTSHGMKVAIMLALADPKQVKVLGKTDLLLVADGTDADQVEADTQTSARKLFALDNDDSDVRARPAPSAPQETSRVAMPREQPQQRQPESQQAQPTSQAPAGYSGMMDSGGRKPIMPGAAQPAPDPTASTNTDDPGLVQGKERKAVAVPMDEKPASPAQDRPAAAADKPASAQAEDAPPPERPAGTERKDDKKKAKGIKGKSGTEKWGDD